MMFMRKILFITVILALGGIGLKAIKKNNDTKRVPKEQTAIIEAPKGADEQKPISNPVLIDNQSILIRNEAVKAEQYVPIAMQNEGEPKGDLIEKFFTTGKDKLPIVETITYKSRVPWIKGRPAWIADYASHYATSRHFIARSLHGKADYYDQRVSPGDSFNVLRSDKPINFYLLIDNSKCKMWFYYIDVDAKEKVFLKAYDVGLGSLKDNKTITPTGKFLLGDKVATYKPGMPGYFHNEKVEMIKIFGTRWIPFKEAMGECSDIAKGYGLHGLPCDINPETKEVVERVDLLGKYDSDGCIRLAKDSIEELYSIVISRPTIVEIVEDATSLIQDSKKIPEPVLIAAQINPKEE
jgi:hypothetical protein